MHPQFNALIRAMQRAVGDPPQDVVEAIRALPPMGSLPSPWTSWLYIALIQYRERQRWGKALLREHLPKAIPPCKELLDCEQPVEVFVPGAPEWQVSLECGYGFAELIDRVTGEVIITGLTEANIEPIIYVHKLNHFAKPLSGWEPTGRLLRLHPSFATVWYAIDELVDTRFLHAIYDDREPCPPHMQPDGHHLGIVAAAYASVVLRFCEQWEKPERRLWLASLIGDWIAAEELAKAGDDRELIALTEQRAEECRCLRCDMVREKLGNGPVSGIALDVLHEMGAVDLPDLIQQGLKGADDSVDHVLWYLNTHDDPSWCLEVFEALSRICPGNDKADLSLSCAGYLLKHGHRIDEVIEIISDMPHRLEEMALLLLEYAPQHALPAIRRALLASERGSNRVAATLAIIDRPWSRQELLDVLEGVYRDIDQALPLVVALEESSDPKVRAIAEEWIDRSDQDLVKGHRQDLQWSMERLRDQAVRLRHQVPAGAAG